MKIVKVKKPIHCCLFDKECWQDRKAYGMPMRLHLNFLERKNGRAVFFTIIPPTRRVEKFFIKSYQGEE